MGEFFQDLMKRETYQAALAELVGTGLLTFAALLAGTPYAVALILAALVYALGPISGAQLNPAVTLGLLAGRRLSVMKAVLYLDAQAAGALLAAKLAPAIGDVAGQYHSGRPAGEFVGAGLLVLTVVAVSDKWVPKAGSGVAIGAALGAGLLLSGGVLNPAVALAMGLGRSPSLWAAALGGVAFALLSLLLAARSQQQGEDSGKSDEAEEQPEREESSPAPHPVVVHLDRPAVPAMHASPLVRAETVPLRSDSNTTRGLRSWLVGAVALPLALLGALWRVVAAPHRGRTGPRSARSERGGQRRSAR